MSLEQTIETDWKSALKSGDHKKTTLSTLRAEIKNWKIASHVKESASDEQVQAVLLKVKKQLVDSLEESRSRPDAVEHLTKEIQIISSYLPTQMTDEELQAGIESIINQIGSKEFPKIMKAASAEFKGKADGKRIQEFIRKIIQ